MARGWCQPIARTTHTGSHTTCTHTDGHMPTTDAQTHVQLVCIDEGLGRMRVRDHRTARPQHSSVLRPWSPRADTPPQSPPRLSGPLPSPSSPSAQRSHCSHSPGMQNPDSEPTLLAGVSHIGDEQPQGQCKDSNGSTAMRQPKHRLGEATWKMGSEEHSWEECLCLPGQAAAGERATPYPELTSTPPCPPGAVGPDLSISISRGQ